MAPHLLLLLEGPLQSWGTVLVDQIGRIDDFPPASMIVGVIGNALGYDRTEHRRLQDLQERLVIGSAILRAGRLITDDQNAKLGKADAGWTTRGRPEGRAGGADAYKSPHRRRRDYSADALVLVAVRIAGGDSDLQALAFALDFPERPLFLGRKPCSPARSLHFLTVEANDIPAALALGAARLRQAAWPGPLRPELDEGPSFPASWPAEEGEVAAGRVVEVCEERDFANDVHVGWRRRVVATIAAPASGSATR